jgi:hypothetical protein
MNWPTQTDYNNALQSPARVFAVPELQKGTVELNRLGVPRARSGAFANVYKLSCGTRQLAVKLFLYPNTLRQERYQAVSEHLRTVRPSCLVPFIYHDRGIRIGGEWFPVQTMDWVKGDSLGEWVRARVKGHDLAALDDMAGRWTALVRELKAARIAHGDLQHDNVLVVNDRPVLVDYDGMVVPRLIGHEALEWGKPAYQHPRRREQPLSLELDDFSAWVILIALRAVVRDASLWHRYVEQTSNENLLFTEDDQRRPLRSPLWDELEQHFDPEVAAWARRLRATLPDGAFDAIPSFEGDDFDGLGALCAARPPDWEALADPRWAGRPLPPALAAPVAEARRRVEARDRLARATAAGDLRQTVAAYDGTLLDDWPACAALVQQARAAREKLDLLDQLRGELRQPGDGRKLVALWGRLGPRLAGVVEAEPVRDAVLGWLARLDACDRYLEAIRVGRDERSIAAAWAQLRKAGGHPDADRHRARGEQAERRFARLDRLWTVPPGDTEDNDRRLLGDWDDVLLQGCREADPFRPRISAARKRLEALVGFQRVTASANQGAAGEEEVLAAAGSLPAGYSPSVAARLQAARNRLALLAELDRVLAVAPPSDVAIAAAWDRLAAEGSAPRDPATVERCCLAVRRRDALRQLQALPAATPADEQDRLWARGWEAASLDDCPDAVPLRQRLELARTRLRLWRELEEALARADLDAVPRLAALPALNGYPPLQQRLSQVGEVVWLAGHLRQLRAAATARPRDWDVLTRLADDGRLDRYALPEDVAPVVAEARRRAAARRRLEQAGRGKSLAAWVSAYDAVLVDDWPACAVLVRQARRARELLAVVRRLEDKAREPGDGTELLAGWDDHSAELADAPEADALRREVARCRERRAAVKELASALAGAAPSDLAVAVAWDRWRAAGGAESPNRERAELAVRRRERLQRLHAIDEALPADEQDRAWLAAWDEELLADCADAEPLRSRYRTARARVDLWNRLEGALNGQDLDAVHGLADEPLLQGYPPAQRRQGEITDLLWRREQFRRMRAALGATPRDWSGLDRLARDGRLTGKPWPADLAAAAAEARRRVAAADALERAVRAGSLRQVLVAYAAPLLDDRPECAALVEQGRRARDLAPLLEELEAAARSAGTGRLLVGMWAKHGPKLSGYQEAEPVGRAAALWKARIEACDAFVQALAGGGERRVADAWLRLQQAGGHPEAARHRPEGERAVARADCLDRLRAVADAANEDGDRAFTGTWQETLLQGCAEAVPLRPRLDEARRRLAILGRLERAVAAGDGEEAIVAAFAELPADYCPRLRPRVELARRRLDGLREVREALAATPVSDEAVADAWDAASALGAAPAEGKIVERCLLAVRRRDRLRRLRAVVANLPADGQDEGLLAEWDDALFADCADSEPLRRRHELARARSGAWHELEAALSAADLTRLPELAAGPLLIDYPPYERRRGEIAALVRTALDLRRVTDRLDGDDPRAFDDEADRAFVAAHPELFADRREHIASPFRAWEIDAVRLTPSETPCLLSDGTRTVSVHFAWRPAQKIKHCLIAVDRSRFLEAPCESDGPLRITQEDYRNAGGGFLLVAPKGAAQLFVTIWPIIDLQWLEMAGPPLHLGPIPLIRLPAPLPEPRGARKSR